MPAAVALAGATLVGGAMSARAAKKAGKQQAQAAREAGELSYKASMEDLAERRRQFDLSRADLMPWMEAGQWGLGRYRSMMEQGAPEYQPFTLDRFYEDPGYRYRLKEGEQAWGRGAASRGMNLSGSTMRGLMELGQNMASAEYDASRQRYREDYATELGNWRDQLGDFAAIARVGQNTGQTLGTLGSQFAAGASQARMSGASALSSAIMGAGQARAAGTAGAGQAWGSAFGTLGMLGGMGAFGSFGGSPAAGTAASASSLGLRGGYTGGVGNGFWGTGGYGAP